MRTWAEHYRQRSSFGGYLNWFYIRHLLAEVTLTADGGPVLEVGVGTGYMSIQLSLQGLAVTGIDNDPGILHDAELANCVLGGAARFVAGDAQELAAIFAPHEFGVAFSDGLLEHYRDDEIRQMLAQQLAVARRVVFCVPSCYWRQQDFGNERLLPIEAWAEITKPLDGRVQMLQYLGTYQASGNEHVIGMLEGAQ